MRPPAARGLLVRLLALLLYPLYVLTRLGRRPRPGRSEVWVRLHGSLPDGGAAPALGESGPRTFPQALELLWAVAADPAVGRLVVAVDRLSVGWARAEELRESVAAVRAAGKRVDVHIVHGGVKEYLVASAADRISLPPEGGLDLAGIGAELTFLRGTLERFGVGAEFVAAGRYKSFGETFTRDGPSPESREALERLVGGIREAVVAAIAGRDGLDPARAGELLDGGPYTAREALAHRLVDVLRYPDQVGRRRERGPDRRRVVAGPRYLRRWRRRRAWERFFRPLPIVAVVPAVGRIADSPVTAPFGPEGVLAPRPFAALVEGVRGVPGVAAMVVRVDSPGGSAPASDLLWRTVRRAGARAPEGVPVVASLGDTAASGGYYLAMAARTVVGGRTTLTGSIGVVAGRFDIRGLGERLGVTRVRLGGGRYPGLRSDWGPLTEAERVRLRETVDATYQTFVRKAARSRRLPLDRLDQAAGGRVWLGADALDQGLIDRLGGLREAVAAAARAAGLERYDVRFFQPFRPGLPALLRRWIRLAAPSPRSPLGAPVWPWRSGEPLATVPFEVR